MSSRFAQDNDHSGPQPRSLQTDKNIYELARSSKELGDEIKQLWCDDRWGMCRRYSLSCQNHAPALHPHHCPTPRSASASTRASSGARSAGKKRGKSLPKIISEKRNIAVLDDCSP
ncbi:hypothetical protein K523DRAFT_159719 [Schizophyllum commune Tattone D]|nr:hypothetical protein K523DRAFT_159719 [Schizophyllum commune Tattone D]